MIQKHISNARILALFLAGLLLFGSCSTKRNTLVTRTFHNVTSRFNGYFYANEAVKEGVDRLEKAHKDDFSKIIPVFIYPSPEEAKGLYPEMDKAVLKLSKVIQRHTITTKQKKEIPGACKWIDDSYILMGRAHFYKRDFFAANESFDYVAKTYKKFPTRFKGMMWLVRSYDELGSISEAESLIDLIVEEKEFPKDYKTEFALIEAYHFILRENYGGAIKPLNTAIAGTRNKKLRARYIFILAQLEQKMGKTKRASGLYSEVIKINPNYDLSFNAQINRARCFEVTSAVAGAAIKKELAKMLKDEKNSEYFDQIYYVLAEIAEKENNTEQCIDYLKKAVRASVSNTTQKAMAYLKLADLAFARPDYKVSQAYYDSTVSLIKSDFPNYDLINNKKKSLSALVKNMNIIAREDSLQSFVKMSPKERDAKIDKLMLRIEAEEKKKEEERLLQQTQATQVNQIIKQNETQQAGSGQWYFYNPTTVNFGITEFRKKWGDRKLEDNWRRASKEIVLDDPSVNTNVDQTATVDTTTKKVTPKVSNKKSREFYLQDIPLSDDAMKRSNDKVIDAYYNLGAIYKEQLFNNPKSAESFEEMMNRYPENKYKLQAYYQLYRLYLTMGNQEKAEYYANIFRTKYPDTEYNKIISNPGYNQSKEANLSLAEKMYTEAYQAYLDSNYSDVIRRCEIADTALGKNPLLSKFDLLHALAIGRVQGIDAFESSLTRIVIKYPKDAVKDKAQEYLDLIKRQKSGKSLSDNRKDSLLNNAAQYLYNKDAEYYWVFVYEGPIDINKVKIDLSNINSEFYSIDNLVIENILLNPSTQMITVKSFTGREKAMIYYNLIAKDKKAIFSKLDEPRLKTFIISAENFPVFYKAKNIGEYLAFFQGNFLK